MSLVNHWFTGLAISSPSLLLIMLSRVSVVLAMAWAFHALLRNSNPRWRILVWRVAAVGIICLVSIGFRNPLVTIPVLPATAAADSDADLATIKGSLVPVPLSARGHNDGWFGFWETSPNIGASRFPQFARANGNSGPLAADRASASSADIRNAAADSESDRSQLAERTSHRERSTLLFGVLLTWAVGLVWGLIRILVGTARMATVGRSAACVPQWVEVEANRLELRSSQATSVCIRHARAVKTPCSVGLFRPVILLPTDLCEKRRRKELQAALAHEMGHVIGNDLPWNYTIHLLSLLLWFHPLVWRIRLAHADACDERCDAGAAESMQDSRGYCKNGSGRVRAYTTRRFGNGEMLDHYPQNQLVRARPWKPSFPTMAVSHGVVGSGSVIDDPRHGWNRSVASGCSAAKK